MTSIIGISGSLRQGSFNTRLMLAAAARMPDGALMETATIHGIPLYDGDVEEREGVPAAAAALKERIAVADGLLLFTPEYNNSIPGPFKNAIDWLTRPSSDVPRVFRGKPTALMGATPGGFGTNLAQAAWLPVLRQLGVEAWFGARLHVARAPDAFDEDGVLKSEPLDRQLRAFLAGFTEFVKQIKGRQVDSLSS
ncbi:MAG TPA: NADPH-dependent FMN reductase [Kiloniellales bacterium]|jgi:chromate reductase|nr:NADPH-dependent FMN reductase [Kiloniellales bacterium]